MTILEMIGADLIEQATRLAAVFMTFETSGFDAHDDSAAFAEFDDLSHFRDHLGPGGGGVVVGMTPPHIIGIASPRAKRHDLRPEDRAGFGQGTQAAKVFATPRQVGIKDVVGALKSPRREPRDRRFPWRPRPPATDRTTPASAPAPPLIG